MNLSEVIKKAKALLSSVKLTQEPLVDGSLIQYSGDQISANEVIYLMSGSENWSVLPDGAYITKAQTQFTITEGVVSAITQAIAPTVENKPVLQAQASEKETIEETKTEEVKLADAGVTVDINDVIQAALQPIYQSISDLQNAISNLASLYVTQDNFSKVETSLSATKLSLSTISDVVEVLSKEPAGTPIEKEVNPFRSVPKEFKDSKTYKAFHVNKLIQ